MMTILGTPGVQIAEALVVEREPREVERREAGDGGPATVDVYLPLTDAQQLLLGCERAPDAKLRLTMRGDAAWSPPDPAASS